MTADIDGEELKNRLVRALQDKEPGEDDSVLALSGRNESSSSLTTDPTASDEHSNSQQAQSTNQGRDARGSEASSIDATTSTVHNLLLERRQRLERQRKAQELAEKMERAAKAKARRAQEEEAEMARNVPMDPKRAEEVKRTQQLRKRQRDAQQERERILRLVENDKLERREKEERRKALARAELERNAESIEDNNADSSLISDRPSPSMDSTKDCAIQVRLLDGSTLRSRFSRDATLNDDIRPWINSHLSSSNAGRGGSRHSTHPYTFKQILTPQPNRTLSISEEDESLFSLGLYPSATLVLFSVAGYTTTAYSGDSRASSEPGTAAAVAAGGFLWQGLSMGYGIISTGIGVIGGGIGSLFRVGSAEGTATTTNGGTGFGRGNTVSENLVTTSHHQPSSSAVASRAGTGAGIGLGAGVSAAHHRGARIKTLRDGNGEEDKEGDEQQFYNGNQVRHLN